jgi:4-deoxy-L-threo-5-hexosulose-uronate ketol-isomerase
MNTLPILPPVSPSEGKLMDTLTLRSYFLLDKIYQKGAINLVYTHYERLIAGVAVPAGNTLTLENFDNLKSAYFLERREIGIINVGGDGEVSADGNKFTLSKFDCVYAGKGTREITLSGNDAGNPPVFFLLSSPAHQAYPVTFMKSDNASPMHIGSAATANERTVYKYIHNDGIQSSQLVMGLTKLAEGSVWNTMPAHVHDRRSEIYFYFDVPDDHGVFHFMGEPQQTRHMVLKNYQAIASPSWSIHSGCGTSNYGFIWGMAGENKEYTDMDVCPVTELL